MKSKLFYNDKGGEKNVRNNNNQHNGKKCKRNDRIL